VRLRARQSTAGRRVLPDFVIIGAQKAGTTSLFSYLGAHPHVLRSMRKEVHFFDLNYHRGERWYRAMFPTRSALAAHGSAGGRALTGEASPYYLFHPLASERAAGLVPGARLIVVLRDPVERAWSHYRHEVRAGRETLDFAAALDAEEERLAAAEQAVLSGGPAALCEAHRTQSYVSRGMYATQLRRWLSHFPRESLLVIDADELFGAPDRAWARTVDFLGLDSTFVPAFDRHNAGTDGVLDDTLRARLVERFTAPNRELTQLLGMPFEWARST
jgi:hypothetical protein